MRKLVLLLFLAGCSAHNPSYFVKDMESEALLAEGTYIDYYKHHNNFILIDKDGKEEYFERDEILIFNNSEDITDKLIEEKF